MFFDDPAFACYAMHKQSIEDFIDELEERDDPIDEYYRKERLAVMNDINDLYEDSYKEFYLKKCADYEDLMQQFEYELMVNEDLNQIVKGYQLLVKDTHIIDEMNEFIKIRQRICS